MNTILPELSVIIPTKNDHESIKKNINAILDYLNRSINTYEIIIVSNNSNDRSVKELDSLVLELPNLKHFSFSEVGKGFAVRKGIELSIYQNILYIDADCSVNISELNKFVQNYCLISPFVIGNRRSEFSINLNSPILRKITGALFNKLVNNLFKFKIEDTQCGFKAINKNIFSNCANFFSTGFCFDVELILLARLANLTITQVPVVYIHSIDSKLKILKDSYLMIKELIKIKQKYKI